ncbi:hypothetical protein QYM36_011657 [Artemia franciscana]|uniref:Uncharacterized protein n=1 Tax=Artemia franciscana TaxID=6661 RepID=A0AA88HXY2_ARTSF|nr:hypothetical protein QYM36_011657 [Artemia franciscana]
MYASLPGGRQPVTLAEVAWKEPQKWWFGGLELMKIFGRFLFITGWDRMIIKAIYFWWYNNLDYGSKARQASSKAALKGSKAALRSPTQFTPEEHLFNMYFENLFIPVYVIEENLKNWKHIERCPANVFSGNFFRYKRPSDNSDDSGQEAQQASSKAALKGWKATLNPPTQFTPEEHLFMMYSEKLFIPRDVIEETMKNLKHGEECPANLLCGNFVRCKHPSDNSYDSGQ